LKIWTNTRVKPRSDDTDESWQARVRMRATLVPRWNEIKSCMRVDERDYWRLDITTNEAKISIKMNSKLRRVARVSMRIGKQEFLTTLMQQSWFDRGFKDLRLNYRIIISPKAYTTFPSTKISVLPIHACFTPKRRYSW
jgi:hypothetical protein